MSNFFSDENNVNNLFNSELNKSKNVDEISQNSLSEQYTDLKINYQRIFMEAATSIRKDIDSFKPKEEVCTICANKSNCNIKTKDIFAPYPPSGCKFRDWQFQVLTYLAGEYKQKLKTEYKEIMAKKDLHECNKCAQCCKLAVSEYSYEQLKQKASRGDKYAQDFVTVFLPYKSEEAKTVNPEYFELLNNVMEDERIYYYYCPKLKDNLCSIYDSRPQICKDFPHNPLKLLPSACSFNTWRNEISHSAMLLKAKTDIIGFYKEHLQ